MKPRKAVRDWLIAYVATELTLDANSVDPAAPFRALGLSSRGAVALTGDLGAWLGRSLIPTLLYDYPSINALADHLSNPRQSAMEHREMVADAQRDAIAVIGMACRFPGADSTDA